MGRFLQRDVNASGLLILSTLAFAGEPLEPAADAFDPQTHYTDGLHLFAFLAADPVNHTDPLGLDSHDYDPFEEVDRWIDERVGNALYTLGQLNEALLGLQTAVGVASALLGVDVLADVAVLASGRGGFWEAMNIVASLNPIGRAARVSKRLSSMFAWMRRGARAADAAVGAFKSFTRRNFRHNLKVLTRWDAPRTVHAYHVLPTQFQKEFKAAGIENIHDPKWGAWWDAGDHLSKAREYNERWKNFLRRGRSSGEIETFARELAAEYGLTINF